VHLPVTGRDTAQTEKTSVATWASLDPSLATAAQAVGMETFGEEALAGFAAVEGRDLIVVLL